MNLRIISAINLFLGSVYPKFLHEGFLLHERVA